MHDAARDILAKLPVAIAVIKEPGLITWANQRALDLLGMPLAELKRRLVFDIVTPVHRSQSVERVGALLFSAALPPACMSVTRANGTVVHFEVESVSVDLDGEPCVISVMHPIAIEKG